MYVSIETPNNRRPKGGHCKLTRGRSFIPASRARGQPISLLSACTWFVFHLPLPRPLVPDAVAEDDCAADDADEAAVEDAELVPPARLEEAPAAALPALGPRDADTAVAARRLPALPMLGLARTLFRLLLPLLLWLLVFPARTAARVGAIATAA